MKMYPPNLKLVHNVPNDAAVAKNLSAEPVTKNVFNKAEDRDKNHVIASDVDVREDKDMTESGISNGTTPSAKDLTLNILKWVALVLPIVLAITGATVWVNSTIDSKSRDNRLEMKADLDRTQDAIQRLSDRDDAKFDKLNDKLDRLSEKLDSISNKK